MNFQFYLNVMNYKTIGISTAKYRIFDSGAEKAPYIIKKLIKDNFEIHNFEDEKSQIKINNKITKIYEKYKHEKILTIGGDHSITYPILKKIEKQFDVFWFDAHPDTYDNYKGKYSHATVLKRVSELPNCNKVYLIGHRVEEKPEKIFLNESKKVIRTDFKKLKNIKSNNYYISLDLDVLDPSIMPSVDHALPNGMKYDELIKSLDLLIKPELFGMDVVEFVPDNDSSGKSEKIIKKLFSYLNKKL